MFSFFVLVIVFCFCSCHSATVCSSSSTIESALLHLQQEAALITSAQFAVQAALHSRKIPVGGEPRSLHKEIPLGDAKKTRIALSTKDKSLECRVTLGKAPIGSKCVAPCNCVGSQEWIQFSLLNRLRRKDPDQWKKCQTCQQPLDCTSFMSYGGVYGNILSLLLDNVRVFRTLLCSFITITFLGFGLDRVVSRLLVSRILWQFYPRWSFLLRFPLPLQYWGARVLLQYATDYYVKIEKFFLLYLTDLETRLIEPNLPVDKDSHSYKDNDD